MPLVKLRRFLYALASIVLLGQVLGLVFCGDVECLQGNSDEICTTLLCGLLADHAAPVPTADGGSNNPCQCLCHVPIDLPKITLYAAPFGAMPHHTTVEVHFFSTPIRNIDHPPLA